MRNSIRRQIHRFAAYCDQRLINLSQWSQWNKNLSHTRWSVNVCALVRAREREMIDHWRWNSLLQIDSQPARHVDKDKERNYCWIIIITRHFSQASSSPRKFCIFWFSETKLCFCCCCYCNHWQLYRWHIYCVCLQCKRSSWLEINASLSSDRVGRIGRIGHCSLHTDHLSGLRHWVSIANKAKIT